MVQYYIDFDGVKNSSAFYGAIKKGLVLPDWCGENPDAIWDMLTGFVEYPATISLHGLDKLPKGLEDEKDLLLSVFHDAVEEYPDGRFIFKTQDSRKYL